MKPFNDKNVKKPFLYSMVFHDKDKKQIISLFDWISCSHTGGSIRNHLSSCVDNLLAYGTAKEMFPKGVVTDFAWNFINAVQLVFNRKTIDEFLEMCFKFLFEEGFVFPEHFVFSVLCCIHLLHNVIKKTKSFSSDPAIQRSFNLFFTVLQTSDNENFEQNYRHIINICHNKFKTNEF